MDRKVPERELLPSYETHQEIEKEDQDETEKEHEETTPTNRGREKEEIVSGISSEKSNQEKEKEGSDTSSEDPDEDSDTEIIGEIQPKRRGPKRKKLEIIPEIPEKQVIRQEKRSRQEFEETEELPTREAWSEDEDDLHLTKNIFLTRPKRWKHINMWNLWGEKFSGCVLDVEKKNKKRFRIQEHETLAILGVDLDKLNYWEYTSTPKSGGLSLKPEGEPSEQAMMASIEL